MANDETTVEQVSLDVTDPEKIDRYKSDSYAEVYANRVELSSSGNDARLQFVHILGISSGKAILQEQVGITMTLPNLVLLLNMLQSAVLKEPEKFGVTVTPPEELEPPGDRAPDALPS